MTRRLLFTFAVLVGVAMAQPQAAAIPRPGAHHKLRTVTTELE